MGSDGRRSARSNVRWNDDLDKSILLFINYACSEAGVKIPFDRVAQLMGDRFSPGGIIQHLAKIRKQMEKDKKEKPELLVPPPNRKGSAAAAAAAAAAASSLHYVNPKQSKPIKLPDPIHDSSMKSNSTRCTLKRELTEDDDDDDPDYEPDSGDTSSVKKAKKTPNKQKQGTLTLRYSKLKPRRDDDSEGSYSPRSVPALSRRLTRIDHTNLIDGVCGHNEYAGAEDVVHEENQTGMNSRTDKLLSWQQLQAWKQRQSWQTSSPNQGHFGAVARHDKLPTAVTMDSTTPNPPNAVSIASPRHHVGDFGELPMLPHPNTHQDDYQYGYPHAHQQYRQHTQHHELESFTNFNWTPLPNPTFQSSLPAYTSHEYDNLNPETGVQVCELPTPSLAPEAATNYSIAPPRPLLSAEQPEEKLPRSMNVFDSTSPADALPDSGNTQGLGLADWDTSGSFQGDKMDWSDFVDLDQQVS